MVKVIIESLITHNLIYTHYAYSHAQAQIWLLILCDSLCYIWDRITETA